MLLIKAILKANSPFMIGSGIGTESDQDVLKDQEDKAFIPGTSLAGVCRHFLAEQNNIEKDKLDIVFGVENKDKDVSLESNIIFYDTFSLDEYNNYDIRDSVRLHNKLAIDKSKFDYEIVEAGCRFSFRIELNDEEFLNDAKTVVNTIIQGFKRKDIRLGAKTTRGFGEFELDDIKYVYLDLSKEADMNKYIEYHFKESDWKDWNLTKEEDLTETLYFEIERKIRLKHFLFIRNYSTIDKVDEEDNESKFVDAATLTDYKGNPVIPGTTWAGAFRNHCRKILGKLGWKEVRIKEVLDEAFGYETCLNENGELMPKEEDRWKRSKSNILFSETKIEKKDISMMNRTRTAIDRFTGSALQTGALYTERTACLNDEKESIALLKIKIRKSIEDFELIKSLIEACITDLNDGMLAIGGNTAIGGGLFTVVGEGN